MSKTEAQAKERLDILIRDFDSGGVQALVSKKRGKRNNRTYADAVKTCASDVLKGAN